ncbi:MAG: transglutaminase family protein [Helicobacteraceae bacterium]|jgi:transglutaminase-like putative cysteine protease|nr:transglutaminase family protein [Helicobacteraceae bacterium]
MQNPNLYPSRRDFIKTTAIAFGALAAAPSAFGDTPRSENAASAQTRRFTITQKYALQAPEGSGGVANLWIPLPDDQSFQRLTRLSFSGDYRDAYITTNNDYGAKTLFATWNDAKKSPKIDLSIEVETRDWETAGALGDYRAPKAIRYPKEVEPFLKPTKHMPVDGIVLKTAKKIVGSESNPLKKARLIYDWVSANMTRDNSIAGCGTGDVKAILESGKLVGKCTDINSVFVALARAVQIPARETFGIRLGRAIKLERYSKTAFGSADENGLSNIGGAQHCRASFYLAGFGWVPCDAADVTKMRLTEKKEHKDAAVQAVNEYLFGNWEMNWIGFNCGRDFLLDPAPEQGAINNFGYPYAEIGGDPLDYYDPKAFSYEYLSQER